MGVENPYEEDVSGIVEDANIQDTSTRKLEDDLHQAMMWSGKLTGHYERNNEFWFLQVNDRDIEPVIYVDDDEAILNDALTTFGEFYDGHPLAIMEETGYDENISTSIRDYRRGEIEEDIPALGLGGFQTDYLQGAYVGPGLVERYGDALQREEKSKRES